MVLPAAHSVELLELTSAFGIFLPSHCGTISVGRAREHCTALYNTHWRTFM